MFKKIIILILLFNFTNIFNESNKALCIVPIADLVGESYRSINSGINIKDEYKKIAISGDKGHLNCTRIHQMLFNEVAEIIEEYNDEVKIKISSVFHNRNSDDTDLKCTYFTLKENLITFDQLFKNNINFNLIPNFIDFKKTNFDNPDLNTITLILPFYDRLTNKVYSAGTRFIFSDKNHEFYEIYIFDCKINNFIKTKINKNIVIESKKLNNNEKINNFINLLKIWTELDNKFIPYVWGGASMQRLVTLEGFALEKSKNCLNNEISFYKRDEIMQSPFSGFDCSGLIARAAQICEIPFFFKNTTTIAGNLKALEKTEEVSNGDIIWFPGHVIVIIDCVNNICVEARGYSSGYAKVHQISIDKIFKNIKNIEELKNAFFNNNYLELLDKKQSISLVIKNFKILKLQSAWNKVY